MSRPQCSRCLRPTAHCLCPLIPSLDSRTRVLLLQHPSEVNHALNTARLAALGLNKAQLVVGEVFEDLPTLLNPPGYQARLLFPADDAQPLQAYAPAISRCCWWCPMALGARRANCCTSIRCWRRCHG
jgi:DTW domain-containing protein YfiP